MTFDNFGKHSNCELKEVLDCIFGVSISQRVPHQKTVVEDADVMVATFAAIWYIASLFGADTCVQLISIWCTCISLGPWVMVVVVVVVWAHLW